MNPDRYHSPSSAYPPPTLSRDASHATTQRRSSSSHGVSHPSPTINNHHASSSSKVPFKPNMSREPDDATRGTYTNSSKTARYIPDRFAPPDNVKYPGGAVANPAFERRTVPPSFRFPARLREMGYGGEDGVYNENDGMLGWRVYRPAKLPHEWAQQITVSKEFIFMVMDVDGRSPIYIIPPACKWCPQRLRSFVVGGEDTKLEDCDRSHPECFQCMYNRRAAESRQDLPQTRVSRLEPSICARSAEDEWEEIDYVGREGPKIPPPRLTLTQSAMKANNPTRKLNGNPRTPSGVDIANSYGPNGRAPISNGKSKAKEITPTTQSSRRPSETTEPNPPKKRRKTQHDPPDATRDNSAPVEERKKRKRKSKAGLGPDDMEPASPYPSVLAPPAMGEDGHAVPFADYAPGPSGSGPSFHGDGGGAAGNPAPVRTSTRMKDRGYEERIFANNRRPPLLNVSGPAPVWASKRRALTSALEYFQNPVSTLGGTVDIGTGGQTGLARMVLLEGDVGEGYVFWGTRKSLGTLVLPLGHPRPIREFGSHHFERVHPNVSARPTGSSSTRVPRSEQHADLGRSSPPPPLPPSPNPAVTQSLQKALPELAHLGSSPKSHSHSKDKLGPNAMLPGEGEAPEIAALLMAHRARTPVALAVAEDYGVVPWHVPRAFISLGWFWITDAWPEPQINPLPSKSKHGGETRAVRWRFRFDWCNEGQPSHPWWDNIGTSTSACLFENRSGGVMDQTSWQILGPGLSATQSIRSPHRFSDGTVKPVDSLDSDIWHLCTVCLSTSLEVYADKHYCLNETCPRYFSEPEHAVGPSTSRKIILRAPRNIRRISPADLGLSMRPAPMDGKQQVEQDPKLAGRDFWKGWCCDRCGMANERWSWRGWECEGCHQRFRPKRRIWQAAALAPPMRPVAYGPRLDDGYPVFPSNLTTRTSSIWEDGLKIVMHGLQDSTEIHHALAHNGNNFNKDADAAFEALQQQGALEIPFKRVPELDPRGRPSEATFSPFYTYLCGPAETPLIPTMLSGRPVPWGISPVACYTTINLMNKLACRIIDGEKEFNSILLTSIPPTLPAFHTPWITVPPFSSYAFLTLGGDAVISFRQNGSSTRKRDKSSVKVVHGDLVIVRTYNSFIEVGLRAEAFGFFAIARQIYPGQPSRADETAQKIKLPLVEEEETLYEASPEPAESTKEVSRPIEDQGWRLNQRFIWDAPK